MTEDLKAPEWSRTHNLYLHRFPTGANICLKNGKTIFFHGGQHVTDDPADIEELDALAKERNGFIYTDPERLVIDPLETDPEEVVKMKAIQEWLAKQVKIQNKQSGDSSYVPTTGTALSSGELGTNLIQAKLAEQKAKKE